MFSCNHPKNLRWKPSQSCPLTLSLSPGRLCRNNKNRAQTSRKRRSGGKVLERQPLICNIQTVHILEMTPLSTSIVYPFLKDRILRLCNPTVSSTRATIATQPLGERDRCEKIGPLAKGGQGCRKSFTAIPLHVHY